MQNTSPAKAGEKGAFVEIDVLERSTSGRDGGGGGAHQRRDAGEESKRTPPGCELPSIPYLTTGSLSVSTLSPFVLSGFMRPRKQGFWRETMFLTLPPSGGTATRSGRGVSASIARWRTGQGKSGSPSSTHTQPPPLKPHRNLLSARFVSQISQLVCPVRTPGTTQTQPCFIRPAIRRWRHRP